MQITPKAPPGPEAVVWDGTNDDEVFALVKRVEALHIWGPLEPHATDVGPLHYAVRTDEPHLGLNISKTQRVPDPAGHNGETVEREMVVARVEQGNVLVFDLFAKTPLFVMHPDELAAFYDRS